MNSEKERLIDALEMLNKEKIQIINSKEYQLGDKIIKTIGYIKKLRFNEIRKKIIIRHRKKIEEKKLYAHDPLSNNCKCSINKSIQDKKIVVYTCITENYDKVLLPVYRNDNVDYIIYTNNKNIEIGVWKKREIPKNIQDLNNSILINRYIKMHPKELFENEYDYAIYIDGNIRTISDISSFVYCIKANTGLAIHRHCVRDCIYMEAEACKLYKKGDISNLQKQIKDYENDGMPTKYGLLECNVIVSDLKSENSTKILDEWWKEFVNSNSMRDQISLPYVLWKLKYNIEDIGNLGNNVRDNPKIQIVKHN